MRPMAGGDAEGKVKVGERVGGRGERWLEAVGGEGEGEGKGERKKGGKERESKRECRRKDGKGWKRDPG